MISDEERREVAARLRNNASQDMDWLIPWAVFNDAEQHSPEAVVRRLADFIEPSCDSDVLLELADEMQFEQEFGSTDYESVSKLCDQMDNCARRIREALGGGVMIDHDLDLYAPLAEDVEPEHVCSTCRHFEPCPCGCEWGVCRKPFCRAEYMTGFDTCYEWEEA